MYSVENLTWPAKEEDVAVGIGDLEPAEVVAIIVDALRKVTFFELYSSNKASGSLTPIYASQGGHSWRVWLGRGSTWGVMAFSIMEIWSAHDGPVGIAFGSDMMYPEAKLINIERRGGIYIGNNKKWPDVGKGCHSVI